MERFAFDREYVTRLTKGDAETEAHFSSYFGDLLIIKLRSRLRSSELVEDARQETLLRVLNHLRNKGGVEFPERLGAFVNSVCEIVLLEFYRAGNRFQQAPENAAEPVDRSVSAEARFITEERKAAVRKILLTLPATDQEILRKVFLQERNKDEICRELSLKRDYLRVRVHRALARFRDALKEAG
ncbi:MAG TPA: sigma-70 family RNA polymerase sigma factor [Bryobacteraceae bacterium]|nr:sigma-70 family RNA polymerase sigma factor [Bryobacteraceae bacterium]